MIKAPILRRKYGNENCTAFSRTRGAIYRDGEKWFDSYAVAAKTFKECDSVLGLPFPACVLKAMKRN